MGGNERERHTHTGRVLPPAFSRLLGQQSVCLLNNRWCGRLACSRQAHTHALSALRPELDYSNEIHFKVILKVKE